MATFPWKTLAMTTNNSPHWFARCPKNTQDWLMGNLGAALSPEAYDAVVAAGGVPVRIETPDSGRAKAFCLHPADSQYLVELHNAGLEGSGR
jgi:hypothetical protein